jgi:phosphatidylglycerol:prolipoprotein diacylglycerol transferase
MVSPFAIITAGILLGIRTGDSIAGKALQAIGWTIACAFLSLGLQLAGCSLWHRLARRDTRLLLIYLGGLFGAALGAKLLYLLAEGWLDYGQPDQWLRWATGKTVLGALAGGYGGVELAKRWVGYPQATGDLFASVAPVGIILGRIGCLLQGCCLGAVCERPAWWTLADRHGHPRWPAVPVEIVFNALALVGFAGLRRNRSLPGQHFHLYLLGYGAFRFVHEFGRDTPRIAFGLSGYQFASLTLIAFAAWRFRQRTKQADPAAMPTTP